MRPDPTSRLGADQARKTTPTRNASRQAYAWFARVLGGGEQEIVDNWHQYNVGADPVDQRKNFCELKVQSGPIPDEISLTRAERAEGRAAEHCGELGSGRDLAGVRGW